MPTNERHEPPLGARVWDQESGRLREWDGEAWREVAGMTLEQAVVMLNRERHRARDDWREEPSLYEPPWVASGGIRYSEIILTEFEAIAIAEKYERGREATETEPPDLDYAGLKQELEHTRSLLLGEGPWRVAVLELQKRLDEAEAKLEARE